MSECGRHLRLDGQQVGERTQAHLEVAAVVGRQFHLDVDDLTGCVTPPLEPITEEAARFMATRHLLRPGIAAHAAFAAHSRRPLDCAPHQSKRNRHGGPEGHSWKEIREKESIEFVTSVPAAEELVVVEVDRIGVAVTPH